MNQRIKQLKHQASVWCDENIPEQFSEETNGYGSAWEEKFAELIVKECAGLLDGEWEKDILCGSDAAGILKQHFGVEE
jgi:hypothetical protein